MDANSPPMQTCARQLEKHGFNVLCVPDFPAAANAIMNLVDSIAPASASYGDSLTLRETGVLERIAARPNLVFYDGFQQGMTREERWEIRRKGMTADLFLSGINAVSEQGTLHWTDMVGNRVAPVAFGPKHVILIAGKNKIVPTPKDAAQRIRDIAPLNAKRHEGFKSPCIYTGKCQDCNSPDRLCNIHVEICRSFPKGRITVILVEKDGGF